jgi:lipid-A-disaccharide synthase
MSPECLKAKTVYLIAGESSGDFIGSKLIEQLKKQNPNINFIGIGGPLMVEQGLTPLFDIKEIAIMGLVEVLSKAFKIKRLIKQTIEDIKKAQPDIIVSIDALGFNYRVLKEIKDWQRTKEKKSVLIHYVAPTVWAWKPKRVKKVAEVYDYLFCLFDFELPYFEKASNLKTYFVGHPIVESGADKGLAENFYNKYNIIKDKKIILLMPGSRHGEVSRLLPIFIDCAEKLKKKYKDLEVVIPTVAHLKDFVKQTLSKYKVNYLVIGKTEDKYNAFAAAKLAIVASGTVSLELGLAKVKTIVAYKVNPITAFIAKVLLKIKYASIINLMADDLIIKEFIQEKCSVENICTEATFLLENKELIDNRITQVMRSLGQDTFVPSKNAADIIINILKDDKYV